MNKPWEINCDTALVFSDFHQNLRWAQAVLAQEDGNFDKVFFAGDAFDSNEPTDQISGIKDTAEFYKFLINNYNVIAGNHELGYMESWAANHNHSNKHHFFHACPGFTNSKSKEINKILTWEDWRKVKLFYVVNGWFVSHAGLHSNFWPLNDLYDPKPENLENNLHWLYNKCDDAMRRLPFGSCELLEDGMVRNQYSQQCYGGIVWCDLSEFDDGIPLPQVFGHTWGKTVRKKGRSYCIDDRQSYAMINRNGDIQIKKIGYKDGIKSKYYDLQQWEPVSPTVEVIELDNKPTTV